jgi:ATP-dependent exoDNAse (exonuclease V) beta subunit
VTTLFDQAAREAIAHDLDHTLFVEAGAGTGKTSALVARLVALVQRGASLTQIAAITFTEAAAAELRERVREALGAASTSGEPGADRCSDALAHFDDTTISTLHAFAQRVLSEFPVEAGLPPGFDVLDDIQASIDFAERWARFLDRLYADPGLERALTVLGALGFRMARLEALAHLVHDDWDRLVDQSLPPTRPVPAVDPAPILAALDAAIAFAPDCCVTGDLLLEHLEGALTEFRDRLAAAGADEPAVLEVLAERSILGKNRGRQNNWPDKPAVIAALARADDAVDAEIDALTSPAVDQLLRAVTEFVRASVEERRRAGRLEFHDLLVLARDLVRNDRAVRGALHDRYHRLLLDEFQDTDPLQIELAVLIASDDPAAGAKPWWECSVPSGRLFLVGDPKQSIYRFRRANIELYHRVRDYFGTRLTLSTNFRSRPAVIEFVNSVFAALLVLGDTVNVQAAYDALVPSRTGDGSVAHAITVVGGEHPKETDLAALRRLEAQELATLIHRVRAEGWLVARRSADGVEFTEPARYADIAVLLPTRATLPYLEQALDDGGIPARIESQSLVYATAEVQELLAVLTAIDDPADEIAIVAALRAPAFACRDDKLAEFRAAGGKWDYRAGVPPQLPPTHPVVTAMHSLRALHDRRWWDTVSETVERVIRERRLMELAVARARPRDHWRRIRFVADAARAFVDGGGTSLRGFVTWLARQVDEEARAVEVVVPEPDDDAVRILTVHGAKGLEFPVVVLAGLGVADRNVTPMVLWDRDGCPQLQIGPRERPSYPSFRYRSAGYDALFDHEQAAAEAEQIRLLYVAATRARDHLIVSTHHRATSSPKPGSHAARLLAPLEAAPDLWLRAPEAGPPLLAGPAAAGPEPADADDGVFWAEQRARLIDAGRRRPVAAATALATEAAADPNLQKDDVEAERPAYRRGRGGTAVGRAVHAVLQTVDLATGAGLEATARAQALAEGVPEREAEIRALAASALESPVVRTAVERGDARWREVPVAAMVDGVLVEGFVDLLLDTPDGLVVVDYKTDQVPSDAELDAAVARYSVQGAAYAIALETALGRPVVRCVFVFARAASAVEREVADLAAVTASVRALLPAFAGLD